MSSPRKRGCVKTPTNCRGGPSCPPETNVKGNLYQVIEGVSKCAGRASSISNHTRQCVDKGSAESRAPSAYDSMKTRRMEPYAQAHVGCAIFPKIHTFHVWLQKEKWLRHYFDTATYCEKVNN